MLYTNDEMIKLIKVLGPLLADQGAGTKIMAGDWADWARLEPMVNAVEADATARSFVGVYASHQYFAAPSMISGTTLPVWETEVYEGNGISTIEQAITDTFTRSNATAWHYWWMGRNDNQGLSDASANPTKRLYKMGNWSRFVRPGWQRLGTTGSKNGIYGITAFKNPTTGEFAIVVANPAGGTINVTIALPNVTTTTVAPYVTAYDTPIGGIGSDGNLSLGSASAGIPTSIQTNNGQFSATIPQGVVTFVGTAQ
jgi:glucuronoarabinoxylan endo-1,4-beta-xylanase